MKIYDIIMIVGLALSVSTLSMAGETIRALITGVVFGVYIGWRLLNR